MENCSVIPSTDADDISESIFYQFSKL